jgi:hypothetical protein
MFSSEILVFSYLIKKWFNSWQRGTGYSISSLHKLNQQALADINVSLNAALKIAVEETQTTSYSGNGI